MVEVNMGDHISNHALVASSFRNGTLSKCITSSLVASGKITWGFNPQLTSTRVLLVLRASVHNVVHHRFPSLDEAGAGIAQHIPTRMLY